MKMIWATWQKKIHTNETNMPGCIFCSIANDTSSDDDNLVLYRGKHNYIVMNLYPYTSGHTLIIPYRHIADYRDLHQEELLEMCQLEQKMITWYKCIPSAKVLAGMNVNRVAGAGIDSPIHRHIVPGIEGDSNFMTTIAEFV